MAIYAIRPGNDYGRQAYITGNYGQYDGIIGLDEHTALLLATDMSSKKGLDTKNINGKINKDGIINMNKFFSKNNKK